MKDKDNGHLGDGQNNGNHGGNSGNNGDNGNHGNGDSGNHGGRSRPPGTTHCGVTWTKK